MVAIGWWSTLRRPRDTAPTGMFSCSGYVPTRTVSGSYEKIQDEKILSERQEISDQVNRIIEKGTKWDTTAM